MFGVIGIGNVKVPGKFRDAYYDEDADGIIPMSTDAPNKEYL